MAVSIMLTSCGKSAGLSNSDKRADNNTNTPSVASSFKGNLPQITDGKNNIKQLLPDYVKDNMFVIGSITIIVIAIAVGTFWIINKKINNKPPKTLKPLPVLAKGYSLPEIKMEFFRKIINGELTDYNIHWADYSVEELIFIYYFVKEAFPTWLYFIKLNLTASGYNVSALV